MTAAGLLAGDPPVRLSHAHSHTGPRSLPRLPCHLFLAPVCPLPEVSFATARRGQLPGRRTGAETGAPVGRDISADRAWDVDRLGHVPLLLCDGYDPKSLDRTLGCLKGVNSHGAWHLKLPSLLTELPQGSGGRAQRGDSSGFILMMKQECH